MDNQNLNVLVIDHSEVVRRKVCEVLRLLGHNWGDADTSAYALSFLAGGDFNFIILGALPGDDTRVSLVQEIRTREKENKKARTPIMVLAPDFTASEFNRTMLAGADWQMHMIATYDEKPDFTMTEAILATLSQAARQLTHA